MRLGRLFALLLFIASWSPTARALPYGSGASDPSVVIGVLATLSGPGAVGGQDAVDAISLGLKQLGGRFSNQEARLVVFDDKASPDIARQQANRLIQHERLDMVVTVLSEPSLLAVLPLLSEQRVFIFNLGEVPRTLPGSACAPNLFSLAPSPEGIHEALGLYMNAQAMRHVVVVGLETDLTRQAVDALKRSYSGQIVRIITPKHGALTFDRELDEIAAIKPDAVYSLLEGGMGGAWVRAWSKRPIAAETALFPVWQLTERSMLAAMGESILNVSGIATWTPDLDTANNKKFVADFESEYGRAATTWAARGYDLVNLLDSALKATGGKTGDADAVRTALRRADFASVRGGFRFNTNHFPVQSYYLRKVVLDARDRPSEEMQAVVIKDWRDHMAQSCPMRWQEEPPLPGSTPAKKP